MFNLRSHRRLPFLVEDQHATATVDVIDLCQDIIIIIIPLNILLTCHLCDAGPSVQVHCPMSTLTTLAALEIPNNKLIDTHFIVYCLLFYLDIPRQSKCVIDIVRRLALLTRVEHNLGDT